MELLERDAALAVLADAYAAAGRAGRIVLVTGEPGIGKTALVREFVRRLNGGSRVLVGACDNLSIKRPLGPLRDVVGEVSPRLAAALVADTPAPEIHSLLVEELAGSQQTTVLVIEDVHWADDATLDALVVVGRRIASLPALVVVTCRDGEVPEGIHGAVDVVESGNLIFLELEPLSPRAVAALAGDDADDVYAATGGNPFFVTELLASRTSASLPPSVASAVLARAARLDATGRRVVELISLVPSRMPTSMLDALVSDWPQAAEDGERGRLLEIAPTHVGFRHELARNAISQSIPAARRRGLHAEILDVLVATGGDVADVVHHAEAAGATAVVAENALQAARRAAAVASNREAFSHYRRAADFLERLAPHEQAEVLEELANFAYLVGDVEQAFEAIGRARAIHEAEGDDEAVGRCARVVSRLHWFAGDGAAARDNALEAISILEPLGESSELARAYSGLAQLAMLDEDAPAALDWAERSLALAEALGDDATRIHALGNVGATRVALDHRDVDPLRAVHVEAAAAGDTHEAVRALLNAAYFELFWLRPETAVGLADEARAYARENDLDWFISYAEMTRAWLAIRAGDWAAAERAIRRKPVAQQAVWNILGDTVAAELAVRRGDDDAAERLARVGALAYRTGELQRIGPILELETVAAICGNGLPPVEKFEALVGAIEYRGEAAGPCAARIAAWAAVVGVRIPLPRELPPPYAAMLDCDWPGAADAFGAIGWSFDRAFFLSFVDDEDGLVEAIGIARELGAAPLTRHVARRMRTLGLKVPRGPRETTRTNPLGLTPRQLQVLELIAAGRTNAEIAEDLVVSTRTAEHHVAAVLTKLGAATRRDAARRAEELRL